MGTRHLTCVVDEAGDFKIAQYGQWDGYPAGAGMYVRDFLATHDHKELKRKLNNCHWITEEEVNQFNADVEAYSIANPGDFYPIAKTHPEVSRDIGAAILDLVYNSNKPVALQDSRAFAGDSLYCEWAWVINFKNNTLEVYRGFNKQTPVLGVFEGAELDTDTAMGYKPITLIKTFSLADVPSEDAILILDDD